MTSNVSFNRLRDFRKLNDVQVQDSHSNLADVHAGVTAEGPDCSQVIGLYQSGDNAILIHFSYHCCIHKVHQAILIQCNTCMKVKNSKLVQK